MTEVIKSVSEALEFTWRKLLGLVTLFAFVILGMLIFEQFSDYFRLQRIERATEIAIRLESLKVDTPAADMLADFRKSTMSSLQSMVKPSSVGLDLHSGLLKFLAAMAPWALLSLLYVKDARAGKSTSLVGALLFGAMVGLIALAIPEFLWPYGNYLIVPVGMFMVILILAVGLQRRR